MHIQRASASRLMAILTAMFALPLLAFGQADLIGVSWDFVNSPVSLLDRSTGARQVIGPAGFQRLNSLARDSSGRLFSVGGPNGDQLITINPFTGAGTAGPLISFSDVRGLAFSAGDQLFAVQDGPFIGAPDRLWIINTLTGVGTLIGGLTYPGIQGLDFAADGTLYGWDVGDGTNPGDGLIRINPLTGASTDVDPATPGLGGIQSLAFGPGNTLYGAGDGLYAIDLSTGAPALIGSRHFADIRGIAVVPEPSTFVIGLLGIVAVLISRRLRNLL